MQKLLNIILISILLTISYAMHAETRTDESEPIESDSTLDVVAWFQKLDTAEYWISSSRWTLNDNDTTQTLGLWTNARIVVTDSTTTGYRMEYTILDLKCDELSDSIAASAQKRLMELLTPKYVGTTVKFETDEFGKITEFSNLKQIQAIAKELTEKYRKATIASIQKQNKDKISKRLHLDQFVSTLLSEDKFIDMYLNDIKLLFARHGNSYYLGEMSWHDAATDTTLENDTYLYATCDNEGFYNISTTVVTEIEKVNYNKLFGAFAELSGKQELAEFLHNEMDSENTHATVTQDLISKYTPIGWPSEVVDKKQTQINNSNTISQSHLFLDYTSF